MSLIQEPQSLFADEDGLLFTAKCGRCKRLSLQMVARFTLKLMQVDQSVPALLGNIFLKTGTNTQGPIWSR